MTIIKLEQRCSSWSVKGLKGTGVNQTLRKKKNIQNYVSTQICPFGKSKFSLYEAWKPDRVNLVAPSSPVHRVRYSTNWYRKGWPGSEIQMYYGCPWQSFQGYRCESGIAVFALEITISVPVAKYFESSPKISTKSLKAKSELVGLRLEKK